MASWAALALLLCLLALLRPIDHDESQYVAAAVLSAHGLIPYRDYAYLQTPLQPFAFAGVAMLAGAWTWPVLRIVNALLGAVAVGAVAGAARIAGATRRTALGAAGLMACTDVLLFSVGTARNDALPVALLALALWLAVRPARSRGLAMLTGLLFAAAAAAKVSYAAARASPMAATRCGIAFGIDRAGVVAGTQCRWRCFVGWTAALAPHGFVFGTLTFPSIAPAQYYAATDRLWKLGLAAKLLDTLKFFALGSGVGCHRRGHENASPALADSPRMAAAGGAGRRMAALADVAAISVADDAAAVRRAGACLDVATAGAGDADRHGGVRRRRARPLDRGGGEWRRDGDGDSRGREYPQGDGRRRQ